MELPETKGTYFLIAHAARILACLVSERFAQPPELEGHLATRENTPQGLGINTLLLFVLRGKLIWFLRDLVIYTNHCSTFAQDKVNHSAPNPALPA